MNGEEKVNRIKDLENHIQALVKLNTEWKNSYDEAMKGTTLASVITATKITDTMSAVNDEIRTCQEEIEELENS